MRPARTVIDGVWEFVVGDDWITAVGVVIALAVTAIVAEVGSAWYVMPLAVATLLAASIWRAARATDRARGDGGGPRPSA